MEHMMALLRSECGVSWCCFKLSDMASCGCVLLPQSCSHYPLPPLCLLSWNLSSHWIASFASSHYTSLKNFAKSSCYSWILLICYQQHWAPVQQYQAQQT